jgi:Chalcone isomerase-like
MVRMVFVLLLSGWAFTTPLAARDVAGIKFDDQVQLDGTPLVLNGAGVRSKFFVKVYVAALYLPKPSQSVPEILAMYGPKRGAMHFLHDEVSKEKLVNAWNEEFESNQNEASMKTLRPQLDEFNGLFQTVHKGDVIVLDYVPNDGTRVTINGSEKGKVLGADFNRALLQIWLGKNPADKDLKQALLGQ